MRCPSVLKLPDGICIGSKQNQWDFHWPSADPMPNQWENQCRQWPKPMDPMANTYAHPKLCSRVLKPTKCSLFGAHQRQATWQPGSCRELPGTAGKCRWLPHWARWFAHGCSIGSKITQCDFHWHLNYPMRFPLALDLPYAISIGPPLALWNVHWFSGDPLAQ